MDMYRRLTRCSDLDMLQMLEQDMKDAFGEPPRQAMVLFALTESELLAGLYGISSIIKKDPDVVLTVADAQKAQAALTGAPGTLRVIDEKTVYLRMPPVFHGARNAADGAEEPDAGRLRPRESWSTGRPCPTQAAEGRGYVKEKGDAHI